MLRPALAAFAVLALLTACDSGEPDSAPAAPVDADSRGGALPVTVGSARAVGADAIGLNVDATIRGVRRDDPAYTAAMAALSPGTIRFPGGTISNYWDWEAGDFVCDGRSSEFQLATGEVRTCELPNGYQSLDPPRHTLDAFKAEIDASGATPVFVANMLSKPLASTEANLDNTVRMLREAERLGFDVRYLEMGNEFYLAKGTRDASSDNELVFPTAADYAEEVARWLPRLRDEFPGLQIAVVGADRPWLSERRRTWNDTVAARLDGLVEAITLHTYTGSRTSPDDPFDIAVFLSLGQVKARSLGERELADIPPSFDVWITEYNMFQDRDPIHGTWAHGLMTASLTMNLLVDERTGLLNAHSGIGNAVFGALFRDDSGFDFGSSRFPSPDTTITTVPFGRTASGETFRLVAEAARGASTVTPLDFGPDAPVLAGNTRAVEGWAFDGGDRFVLLNLSPNEQTVSLGGLARGAPSITREAAPLDRPDGTADAVEETRGRVRSKLRLPPYSLTRLGG